VQSEANYYFEENTTQAVEHQMELVAEHQTLIEYRAEFGVS